MFRIFTTIWILMAMVSVALGDSPVSHYQLPQPYNQQAPADPELANLVWNKWDTENFTILSLDAEQGKYLYENIEQMKKWVLSRWGFPDIKFASECRVLCVPNRNLMKKLFRLDRSHGEVRRDESGKIVMSVLWLVLDGKPAEVIPSALTMVAVSELENYGAKMGYWAIRGMSILNGTLPQIRQELAALNATVRSDQKMFFSDKLFSMTEQEWRDESLENRQLFDREAAALCLLLRKEFGQHNLHNFLKSGGGEQNFVQVYGFRGYQEFDATLRRYMAMLSQDVMQNRTPDDYLQIFAAE